MTMTSTLHKTRIEADRPWTVMFLAPETAIADVSGRCAQVEACLSALAPAVRPLALSMQRCWRELDTGLLARGVDPEPALAMLVGELDRFGAVLRPAYAEPPTPALRGALTPSVVRAWLGGLSATKGPAGITDWCTLESLAVRVSTPADRLELTGLSRTLDAVRDGRDTWVAGPVDNHGFGQWAPIHLRWSAESARVSLEVSVHWMRWAESGNPEQTRLAGALAAVEQAGWQRV